ncbi:hypothetical protein BDQ94DRAFT_31308 [Aspergillus welwitschiae]|uniref:Uncharacterized protein n=1 Tax=Aspergillus welwitschiae TaxID=1341132 RepID=A0A3F3Q2Z3_9EURO|nr:hypothetical protein BDQ94DRAFT_31308 [Aspergillus welwitschiae]RDH33594.1 hypothetical protein BDQ94DRAFT_31308 [Aspergillus welwitschiae]
MASHGLRLAGCWTSHQRAGAFPFPRFPPFSCCREIHCRTTPASPASLSRVRLFPERVAHLSTPHVPAVSEFILTSFKGNSELSSGIHIRTSCASAGPLQRCSEGLACRAVTQTTPPGRVCIPVSSFFVDSIGGTYARHRDCSRHEVQGRVEKTEEPN